jgi:PPM family protein phosphatase
MLRVAEQYATTDTGLQRRVNEDALLARAPLFVVADGMGGAQAGEVASRIAVECFQQGLEDAADPERRLLAHAQAANARIYELSHSHAEQAGMGTTLTAVYVGEREVAIAHVGDSRAYCLRDGELERLTDDHSLVDELMRQGRLTPEEAVEHPQRSVITRALGPEATVEVDIRSYRARPGDVYLLCSDGLTGMISEARLAEILRAHSQLRDAGEALIAAANEEGGRDNITVVLLRLEEVAASSAVDARTDVHEATSSEAHDGHETDDGRQAVEERSAAYSTGAAAPVTGTVAAPAPRVTPRRPRRPAGAAPRPRRRRMLRRTGVGVAVLVVLGLLVAGAYTASRSVYFLGTNSRGLVTLYRGVPFELPGGVKLYSSDFVSGVGAATLAPPRRHTLLDHSLRSRGDATDLVRKLELGQLGQ